MKKINFSIFLLLCSWLSYAQQNSKTALTIQHLEPAFWWVGMKNPELQILVHGKDIAKSEVSIQYEGVTLKEKVAVENPNYLFLYLHISPTAKTGTMPIKFTNGKNTYTHNYELKAKSVAKNRIQGFTNADAMYLLMPDRFANGDYSNDASGMKDTLGVNRKNGDARHGGDLKGIEEHLDYIKDLGMTSIWINPVLENDMDGYSYHGYAMTDLYKVDKRLGGNEAYLKLIDKAHEQGIKIIMDMVANHVGTNHWFIKDLPMSDWIHKHDKFTRSNFRLSTISDPYVSKKDLSLMTDGWFDVHMADLNQQNRHLATYLIQNSIWWIEYSGIDGIRMDTYPYPDKTFMTNWAKAILTEYPQFNIVGEVWIHNSSAIGGYWQAGSKNWDGYESALPSITDFPIQDAITKSLQESTGWDTGLARLYYTLAEDFVNPMAYNNVIFLDNHDVSRFFTTVGEDVRKQKMAIAFLATLRGIPQLYYGTELALSGSGDYHPNVRQDFLGGWKEDSKNWFTATGRDEKQNDVFNYTKKIFNYRKQNSVLHTGKLVHFVPENDTYVYARYDHQKTVLVIANNGNKDRELDMSRFEEVTSKFTQAQNIVTDETITNLQTIKVPAMTVLVLELK
jgi:glycosidase